MKPGPDLTCLSWHASWISEHAQKRAAEAFLAMQGEREIRDGQGLELWERRGLALADEVSRGMEGIETTAFIETARQVAVVLFLRRLHHLARVAPKGGTA